MGFTGKILSDKAHYEEFVCSICCQLVDLDEAVLTNCQHVFCTGCMRQWLGRQRNCPICKLDLSLVTTSALPYLKSGSPLAWRVLSRVRISCPLGCGWEGDYYSLQGHLTSSTNHVATNTSSKREIALGIKLQANEKYSNNNFKDALKLYSQAIATCDEIPELFTNRAAVYPTFGNFKEALQDAKTAVALDPASEKAWKRGLKAYIGLGEFTQGIAWVSACTLDSVSSAKEEIAQINALLEKATRLVNNREYEEARTLCLSLLQKTTANSVLKLACVCEIECGAIERSLKLALQLLRSSSSDPSAYIYMAQAQLYSGKLDEAMKFVKEGLRLDPDHTEAKVTFKRIKLYRDGLSRGEKAAKSKEYDTAATIYSELIQNIGERKVPLRAQVLAERGNAYFRLQQYPEALQDCGMAIYVQDDCKRAWLTKNYVLHAQGQHSQALKDMEGLMSTWGANDSLIRAAYEKAQFLERKAKRPDYYAILSSEGHQLSTVSSEPEIKAAYKQKALVCHPDRLPPDASKEERQKAEADFKLCGEAFEVLTSEFQRKLYDEGFDQQAIQERIKKAQDHQSGQRHHHR